MYVLRFVLSLAVFLPLGFAQRRSALSCSQLRWSLPFVRHMNSSRTNVCGASQFGAAQNFACFPNPVGYRDASRFCLSLGARLCSVAEMEDDVTELTGCFLDPTYIWTKSSRNCAPGFKNIAAGASKRALPSVAACCRLTTTCASRSSAIHNVRCCADNFVARSPRSCSQLNWPRTLPQTCAIVRRSGTCLRKTNFDMAEETCANFGGRLCTIQEIQQGVLRGQGCTSPGLRVWTHDTQICNTSSASTIDANGLGAPSCQFLNSGSFIRCCADNY
uniref:C-type lectin domain-containing protein n=1 Tax=Compsopogon caeruleus TaxID=31354 RepID=A0A7S1XAN8_9RHOD|mmetsp:Transcript_10304/g.20764  ORF Transcript_10304/g.20764 Transcript_10304/m.20764 type:complete len:275 (+) Transcript_10304:177-1001(+)